MLVQRNGLLSPTHVPQLPVVGIGGVHIMVVPLWCLSCTNMVLQSWICNGDETWGWCLSISCSSIGGVQHGVSILVPIWCLDGGFWCNGDEMWGWCPGATKWPPSSTHVPQHQLPLALVRHSPNWLPCVISW